MDSRSGFGILLVILGIFGVWMLVTGKISGLLKAAAASSSTGSGSSSSSSATPAAAAAQINSSPPAGYPATPPIAPTSSVPPLYQPPGTGTVLAPNQPLSTSLQAYGIAIGGDGLAIEPLGGVRVLA